MLFNVFTTNVKTGIGVATGNVIFIWGRVWQVKIISLISRKVKHSDGPIRDIISSIFWAVTPLPLNHFHI